MSTCIYEKTEKGREEIATRKHQVSPRLRTLLVMIDGRQPLSSLLQNFSALGFDKNCIDELLEQEYIRALPSDALPDPEPARAPAARVAPGLRRSQRLQLVEPAPGAPDSAAVTAAPVADVPVADMPVAEVPVAEAPPAPSEAARFSAVYSFYNDTIRGNLGLRGFTLQLKVEKAATLDDLRTLRMPYLEAVTKAKGTHTAQALDARLLSLLGEGALD